MTRPKTLLQMAGAPRQPPTLAESAVVMIDAQREYVDGALPLTGIAQALEVGADLLARARAAGSVIIHVVHQGRSGGPFDPDGPGGQIVSQVAPVDGEAVIAKTLPNAFAGTDLQEQLRATGREPLIFAGFMTHMCVSSSVRAALDLGFRSTVVAGACATRDLPLAGTGVVSALDLHAAELAALADRFAIVVADGQAWD